MAITTLEYTFLSAISKRNIFPPNPHVLELGEQHWHGDISIEGLKNDILNLEKDEIKKEKMLNNLYSLSQIKDKKKNFDLAKIAYKLFLDYSTISAIDLHGTDDALKFDLNEPIKMNRTFDVTINCGTGEHIFNIYQFFKTIHEVTAPEGIMIHVMPFLGWTDHGFFNIQPTLYWDLAQYNNYEVVAFVYQSSPATLTEVVDRAGIIRSMQSMANQGNPVASSNIYVALKKNSSQPFRIPMQEFFQISKDTYWDMMIGDIPIENKDSLSEEFNLREINLIVFPNWNQSDDLIFSQLGAVIKVVRSHSECHRMTLLIVLSDVSRNPELSSDVILSTIMMNCLLEGDDNVTNDEPEISIIEDLDKNEWDMLFQKVRYRIVLPTENSEMVEKLLVTDKVESCNLDTLKQI